MARALLCPLCVVLALHSQYHGAELVARKEQRQARGRKDVAPKRDLGFLRGSCSSRQACDFAAGWQLQAPTLDHSSI